MQPLFTCHILSVGFFPYLVTGCREAQCQILLNNSYLQWPNQNLFLVSLKCNENQRLWEESLLVRSSFADLFGSVFLSMVFQFDKMEPTFLREFLLFLFFCYADQNHIHTLSWIVIHRNILNTR